MKNATIFSVNLQQGFILNDHGDIEAAYDMHNRTIICKCLPKDLERLELPTEISQFKKIFGETDCFSINGWTNDGYKSLYDIKERQEKRIALKAKTASSQ